MRFVRAGDLAFRLVKRGGDGEYTVNAGKCSGKLLPLSEKNEYSLAGFVYSADFILLTRDDPVVEPLDCFVNDENGWFVVVGVRKYQTHREFVLETKVGKGALV